MGQFRLCQQGAPLVGIGANRYFSADGELWLDAGPFIRAVEYAAGVKAVIMGKPSRDFFRQAIAAANVDPGMTLMVGDDVYGDVEGALNAGLAACLVRTGKYQAGDETRISGVFGNAASLGECVADLLQ